MTTHVYISPHLDDAVISCGGLIARQAACGETVAVLTVCAGDPPQGPLSDFARTLHMDWQVSESPVQSRRREDLAACKRLGATAVHLEIPDAIYRLSLSSQPLYPSFDDIFGPLHPAEDELVQELARSLNAHISPDDHLYGPLAFGAHVDHRLARLAAELLDRPLLYYRDMPYGFRDSILPADLPLPAGKEHLFVLTTSEINAWQEAALEYRSQISSFWDSDQAVLAELVAYHEASGGLKLIERS